MKTAPSFALQPRALLVLGCVLFCWQPVLRAQDQTIGGDLIVGGSLDVSGPVFNLGTRSDHAAKPGLNITYAEDGSQTATLSLTATRPIVQWQWMRAASAASAAGVPQMTLGSGNALTLYDVTLPTPAAAIVLDPVFGSTFGTDVTLRGANNRMPNQAVSDAASVLTVGLADARYLAAGAGTGVSLGGSASASAVFSAAVGYAANSAGYAASALGPYTVSSGFGSTAVGASASATNQFAVALGNVSLASGSYSLALGKDTRAEGTSSVAISLGAHAAGERASALGQGSLASGVDAMALGAYSSASGDQASALGEGSRAAGLAAMSLGAQSIASGFASSTLGASSQATNSYSLALGHFSVSSGVESVTLGRTPWRAPIRRCRWVRPRRPRGRRRKVWATTRRPRALPPWRWDTTPRRPAPVPRRWATPRWPAVISRWRRAWDTPAARTSAAWELTASARATPRLGCPPTRCSRWATAGPAPRHRTPSRSRRTGTSAFKE